MSFLISCRYASVSTVMSRVVFMSLFLLLQASLQGCPAQAGNSQFLQRCLLSPFLVRMYPEQLTGSFIHISCGSAAKWTAHLTQKRETASLLQHIGTMESISEDPSSRDKTPHDLHEERRGVQLGGARQVVPLHQPTLEGLADGLLEKVRGCACCSSVDNRSQGTSDAVSLHHLNVHEFEHGTMDDQNRGHPDRLPE